MIEKIKEVMERHSTKFLQIYFDAGGDQINDLSEPFIHEVGDLLEKEDKTLLNDILNYALDKVEIYANSDGHYQGEYGQVIVEIITEDGEEDLEFSKVATSTYNETHEENFKADSLLTQNLIDFCKENVEEILLESGSREVVANYSKDIILTEEIEELLEEMYDQLDECLDDLIKNFNHEVYQYNLVYTIADNNITIYLQYEEFSDY